VLRSAQVVASRLMNAGMLFTASAGGVFVRMMLGHCEAECRLYV
jgi:hypothetical protein